MMSFQERVKILVRSVIILMMIMMLLLLLLMTTLQTVEIRLHPDSLWDRPVVGDDGQSLAHFLDIDSGLTSAGHSVQAVARRTVHAVVVVAMVMLVLMLLLLIEVVLMRRTSVVLFPSGRR